MHAPTMASERPGFFEELALQRWDDHRFYHQSYVNQALHFFSALCFLTSYVFLAIDPVVAVLAGWILAMISRQIGHFFFERKGFDEINRTTHEHKEAVKVGYNLQRKVVLLSVWAASPLILLLDPTFFGLLTPREGLYGFLTNLAYVWIAVAATAVLGRTLWLALTWNVQSGVVWCTKILTDPFHDVWLYHRAPLQLMKGERFDPMTEVRQSLAQRA